LFFGVSNYRHCRARRIVENAFGILASTFRLFRRPIPLAPTTVVKITKAACSLYNFIRKSGLNQDLKTVDIEDLENGCIIPGDWINEPESTGFVEIATANQRNYLLEARKKRDTLAEYFINEGDFSWQDRMIQ